MTLIALDLPPREPWMEDASCTQVDPEIWYPEKGGSDTDAKQICRTCPVLNECRAYALDHEEVHGTWGALSAHERRRILTARKKGTAA